MGHTSIHAACDKEKPAIGRAQQRVMAYAGQTLAAVWQCQG